VRTKYKTDLATYSDVIKAQVELGKLENELLSVKFLQEPIRVKLNALLNRPTDIVIPFPKTIPEEKVNIADEQFIIWLKEKNPELKALDFEIEKEKRAIERAKREYYPDIMLGIEYMDSPTPSMPEDNDYAAITGMISVNLPIWFGKYKAGVREAEARYTSVQKKRIDKENNLIADLKMALYELRDAERKIDLYKNTLIPKAEQSLQATQQTFTVGKASFLDLIDAQRIFLEFKLSYERALTDSAQKLAELEMLVGRDITEIKQGTTN
jgi:outer membrane protein TolC